MRIVVTGAAGFIGSHVSECLWAAGHEILALDDLSGGVRTNLPASVRFEQYSVLSPLDELFGTFRPHAVYHLAAYAAEGLSHHIPVFNYQNNVVGTANVLAAAYRAGVEHFVFTSSIAVYGHPYGPEAFAESMPCNPCDPYGVAKLACEHHIKAVYAYFGRPAYTIFRPHNVFGPRQNISDPYRNVVGIFMNRALRGMPLPVFGDGSQTRSFSYISTVARCIADAPWTPDAKNTTINVGGDESMSVRALAELVLDLLGASATIESLPARNEVLHAHCKHELARHIFPKAYAEAVDIKAGLKIMAHALQGVTFPQATECPSTIEIIDRLPPSWKNRITT